MEREKQRQEKEQSAQMLYMQKMAGETDRRRQAEGRMTTLEREEKELIARLRKTQEMQETVSIINLHCLHFCFIFSVSPFHKWLNFLSTTGTFVFTLQAYAALQKSLRT